MGVHSTHASARTLHAGPRERDAIAAQLAAQKQALDGAESIVLRFLLAPDEELTDIIGPVSPRALETRFYHGYGIASVVFDSHDALRVSAATSWKLITAPVRERIARPRRIDPTRMQSIRAQIAALVVNAQDLQLYARIAKVGPREPVITFSPTQRPSLDGSPVEMLILTHDALQSAFQEYADARTAVGVPTVVRTVEWVEQNYPHGADLQETLRLFVRDAYELWGVRYLLLGGDTQVIPARYAYSTYTQPPTEVPTDLYYACLDRDWNADGDALWGEAMDFGIEGDNADLAPEVAVGRLPVVDPTQVDLLLAKLDTYTSPALLDYQDRLLFLAEVLWPANYSGGTILKHGADGAERLIALNDLDDGSWDLSKLYEAPAGYAGAETLTRDAAIDSINSGHGMVVHIGHGFRYTMSLGDFSLTNVHASSLTNSQRPFFLAMLNCTASAFDFPCLAEQFLLSPDGGAVGVVGASREAFPDGSQLYLEEFFERIFADPHMAAGPALDEARLGLVGQTLLDTVTRWTTLITAYLGDPSLHIWRNAPSVPTVTHDTSLSIGSQGVAVQVTAAATPVSGATVALWKPGDFYVVAKTDLSGSATFDVRAETAGSAAITVSGPGLSVYRADVPVSAAVGPALHVLESVQIDDAGPGTVGNGNGALEAGEEAMLLLDVRNEGDASAADVTLTLSASDPFLSFPSPTVAVGDLMPGQTLADVAVSVLLHDMHPDRHHVEIDVTLSAGAQTWSDRIAVDLLQAGPRLVNLTVVDPDSSGTPEAGEAYDLHVEFKNYGFAQLNGASATLGSTDPDVQVLDGSATVGDVTYLGSATAVFQLRETDVSSPNWIDVQLVDTEGHAWSFALETRRPSPPTDLHADVGGPDFVRLSWLPSPSGDVAGYNVYRAPDASGPWSRANQDVVTSASFFGDRGLEGSTTYHYAVASIDTSGNESAQTAAIAVTTNPVQAVGWPRVMREWSGSPPLVVDTDGDQRREIFVGADRLYAWSFDGKEILDGDGDASTDGVFSALGENFSAGPAAGDLDADGLPEIVACSWETREVFIFDADGSLLPGWPRPLVEGTTLGIWAAPSVVDLDLNGTPEVVVLGLDGRLYAWNADGSEFIDGDSDPMTDGVFYALPPGSNWSRGGPSVANLLTDDANPEIVIATSSERIYVLRSDGSVATGWPRVVGDDVTASPSIGDIDGNGSLDIAVPAIDGFLYVLQSDGSDLPGWPIAFETNWGTFARSPSVALHDFDADGKLELVVGGSDTGKTEDGALWMFDWQGNVVPGWPVDLESASQASPVIGDLDGDTVPEIIYGGESGIIHAFAPDGSAAPGFPIQLGAELRATPAITNVDFDADVDLVASCWDQRVYVFDLTGAYVPGHIPWSTFRADMQRSGAYVSVDPTDADEVGVPQRTQLLANVPNPFNPSTRIQFELAAAEHARLQIFDASGRLVRTLVDAALVAGRHTRVWDGRDDAGRATASGVYFYRLVTPRIIQNRKMVLVR
ncbi:MAG: VCBS repeat-containing protein [Candidatus Latescibacterota bacterium]|nr:MAG: VCBS repeat-containing protein [Candidatus Latescibacterota bacterium]